MAFAQCPLRYNKASEHSCRDIYQIGDDRLLVGHAMKETFLAYANMYATRDTVHYKSITSKFSELWAKYNHLYYKIGKKQSKSSTTMLTTAYDKVIHFKKWIPRDVEVAIVNMPYIYSFKDCDVEDVLDLLLVHKIPKSNKTFLEAIIIDNDVGRPSRNALEIRIRAILQEKYIHRDLSSQHTKIVTSIFNPYNDYKIDVGVNSKNKSNYKQVLAEIIRCIETKAKYPVPNQDSCSRCIFSDTCEWSSKR